MDKTVELVTQWAEFAARNPDAKLEDFYRYELIGQRESQQPKEIADGIVPPQANLLLIKLIDRIDRLYLGYAEVAIAGAGLKNFEEFIFLNAIAHLHTPRKTDVITHVIKGLSSGLLIIDRLKKYGYVDEKDDAEDKRTKRLTLTKSGMEVLQECYKRTSQLAELYFADLSDDDARLCIQLLKGIEIKFSRLWPGHKGQSFAEIREAAQNIESLPKRIN